MSSNKKAREALESVYGRQCMFKRAKIAERIEAIGGIKTYRKFLQERKYTLKDIKKLEKILTYHHLRHKFEDGKATIENGAEVNVLAHSYMHSLPREHEEVINNMLRNYKNSIECSVEFIDNLDFPYIINTTVFIPDELNKRKRKYNRAKEKRKWQEEIEL